MSHTDAWAEVEEQSTKQLPSSHRIIIEMLERDEFTAAEVAESCGVDVSTVDHMIRSLRKAGFIESDGIKHMGQMHRLDI